MKYILVSLTLVLFLGGCGFVGKAAHCVDSCKSLSKSLDVPQEGATKHIEKILADCLRVCENIR